MIQNDIEGGGKKVQETTGETKQLRRIGQKDHKDSDVCVTQDMVDHNSLILSDNTSRALDGNQILSVNTSRELLILLRVVKEAVVREVRPRRSQGQASAQCLPNCIIIATIITCNNYFAYDLIILHDKVPNDDIKTIPRCNKKPNLPNCIIIATII